MIQRTFYEDVPERDTGADLWSWLRTQSQDAWLLWSLEANADLSDSIFEHMIQSPECDLAVVSHFFWHCAPDYYVRHPEQFGGSFIAEIIKRVELGFYKHSHLNLAREETLHGAQAYIKALRDTPSATWPFRLPRALCGPFSRGRDAQLPEQFDAETEADLAEIFEEIDGGLPRSYSKRYRERLKSGNYSIPHGFSLPPLDHIKLDGAEHWDDATYIEAIYGDNGSYHRALSQPKKSWWPFS